MAFTRTLFNSPPDNKPAKEWTKSSIFFKINQKKKCKWQFFLRWSIETLMRTSGIEYKSADSIMDLVEDKILPDLLQLMHVNTSEIITSLTNDRENYNNKLKEYNQNKNNDKMSRNSRLDGTLKSQSNLACRCDFSSAKNAIVPGEIYSVCIETDTDTDKIALEIGW
ncbi:hypothetical protein RclHR1_02680025 [Rhizophagus clarus]|uniref:Uncharacterized protein n=1 Tax=Rhizophagus clarus TaxID=94130 RepID=A0A2Z6RGR3_9GLOM|nr:hypothetical protein RclHR1_02680025 [Rhizophagus clarus]GES86490.1 hypothetical protein GLOIN_2v1482515 [Rhizophagus clarus]